MASALLYLSSRSKSAINLLGKEIAYVSYPS